MARGVWTYVGGRAGNKPPAAEKAAVTAACERLITDVLQPRYLPEGPSIRHGQLSDRDPGQVARQQVQVFHPLPLGRPNRMVEEFDAPVARLDYVSGDRFDLMWHRHTGAWHCVGEHLSLAEALDRIANEPYFFFG